MVFTLDLVIADFLVALSVGSWLGEGRALVPWRPVTLCMHCTTRTAGPSHRSTSTAGDRRRGLGQRS